MSDGDGDDGSGDASADDGDDTQPDVPDPPAYADDYNFYGIDPNENYDALTVSCDYIRGRADIFDWTEPPVKTKPYTISSVGYSTHSGALAGCSYDFEYLDSAIKKLNNDADNLFQCLVNWFGFWPEYQDGLANAAAWYEQAEDDNQKSMSAYFTHDGQVWTPDGWEDKPPDPDDDSDSGDDSDPDDDSDAGDDSDSSDDSNDDSI